jgi:hypothetical protein
MADEQRNANPNPTAARASAAREERTYPEYRVKVFAGDTSVVLTGTHAGTMVSTNPPFSIGIKLDHENTRDPIPGQAPPLLILTVTKK